MTFIEKPDPCTHPPDERQRRLRGEIVCKRCMVVVGYADDAQIVMPAVEREDDES